MGKLTAEQKVREYTIADKKPQGRSLTFLE